MATEFELKRAQESFRGLFELCKNDTLAASQLIAEMADCEIEYPASASALFLIGMLYGICASALTDPVKAFNHAVEDHDWLKDLRPKDYIGNKRAAFIQPVG